MKVLTNLLLLILVCVGGLFALEKFGVIALNEEENTDNDVAETLPEESDVLELTISCEHSDEVYVIQYEEGMTWAEWIESKYSSNLSFDSSLDEDYINLDNQLLTHGFFEEDYLYVFPDDIISNDKVYILASLA